MGLKTGDLAPDFTLLDRDRKPRSLKEFTTNGLLVLAFFPGAFTSTCTREMCTLRDYSKLSTLGAQVVGISVNDPWTLAGFARDNSLTFPLLSDYTRTTIRAYGVELPDFGGVKGYTVAQRSIFILGREGVIRYIWIAPQPGIEPDYKALGEQLERAV